MIEQEKISEFIDWAIANVQAIANIRSVPSEDVYDAISALSDRGLKATVNCSQRVSQPNQLRGRIR